MGKKRIIDSAGQESSTAQGRGAAKSTRKKIERGILYINATYNNTALLLTNLEGQAFMWSSSGSLGFKGAKKGTPFAAGKVGEMLAEKAQNAGLKEVDVIVKGVGAGRESSIRSFTAKGISINSIKDKTPVPFNGPRPPKPRRV